jgi:hypothetical protein
MLAGGTSILGLPLDFTVLAATLIVLVLLAGWIYPHIAM